jgi:hypothetical protein
VARIERIIVGYREGDPRIRELWEVHGRTALPHKKCIADCGAVVYFVESGQDAIRTRDPEPICDVCWSDPNVKRHIYATEL